MPERGWVSMEWQGQLVYAKAGEWIVGLERPQPTFGPSGELIDLNIEWAGPNTPPDPELQRYLQESDVDITFGGYAGSRDIFLVRTPESVTYEQLAAALAGLPKFSHVGPNAIDLAAGAPPSGQAGGELAAGGDVTVRVARGTLRVQGDNAANAVGIAAGPTVGEFIVRPQGGTTLNGQSGPVTLTGVTRGIRAKLGAGDDRLSVTGPALPGDVSLDLGRGTDALTLDGTSIGRNLAVRGAPGAKTLDLRGVAVAGRTALATGSDADAVSLVDSTFTGRATIRTGGGDDSLTGSAVFAAGRSIEDGPGEDVVTIIEGL